MYQKINQILSVFDVYASGMQLKIMGETRFSSLVGKLCTIIIMIPCALIFMLDFLEILNQHNPNVFYLERETITPIVMKQFKKFKSYYFDKSNFTLAFLVSDVSLNGLQKSSNIYTVTMQQCQRTRNRINSTNVLTNTSCQNIPVNNCTMDHFPTESQQTFFQNFRLFNMYCIDLPWWEENKPVFRQKLFFNFQKFISGFGSSDYFAYLQLVVTPCQNTTSFNSCASPSEIAKKLSNGYAISYLASSLQDTSKKGNPYQLNTQLQYTPISSQLTKTQAVFYVQDQTISDVGIFNNNDENHQTLVLSNQQEFSQPILNQSMYVLHIQLDNKQKLTYRSYQKVQNILGNIGGLWSIFFTVVNMFINPLIQSLLKMTFVSNYSKAKQSKKKKLIQQCQDANKKYMPNSPQNSTFRNRLSLSSENHIILDKNQLTSSKTISQGRPISSIKKPPLKKNKQQQWKLLKLSTMHLIQKQTSYSHTLEKLDQYIDILTLINKFLEVDKLKKILLNENQLKLFDFIEDDLSSIKKVGEKKDNSIEFVALQNSFVSILQDQKKTLNKNIIKFLDKQVKDVLHSFGSDKIIVDESQYLIESESKPQTIRISTLLSKQQQ